MKGVKLEEAGESSIEGSCDNVYLSVSPSINEAMCTSPINCSCRENSQADLYMNCLSLADPSAIPHGNSPCFLPGSRAFFLAVLLHLKSNF